MRRSVLFFHHLVFYSIAVEFVFNNDFVSEIYGSITIELNQSLHKIIWTASQEKLSVLLLLLLFFIRSNTNMMYNQKFF